MAEKNWQEARRMSPAEYISMIRKLKMSRAASARFLGVSEKTAYRYANGTNPIPDASVLLLRALVEFRVTPIVPKWSKGQN